MTIKTETKTEPTTAPVTRGRSVSRGELHRRIAAREAARKDVAEKNAASRRLQMQGEAAAALASQLAGLRTSAASKLADHALKGESGAPSLAADGRAELMAKLVEAEALAEAAGPALALVEAEILKANVALTSKVVAVQAVVVPVLEEELEKLTREIQALNGKLLPLRIRLSGLVDWSRENGFGQNEEARGPFFRLMTAATEAVQASLLPAQIGPQGTATTVWGDLASRLVMSADAQIAPYAEAA